MKYELRTEASEVYQDISSFLRNEIPIQTSPCPKVNTLDGSECTNMRHATTVSREQC